MEQQQTIYQTKDDKLKHRLSMTYTERFKALMQMIRIRHKLQNVEIIKKS